MKIFLRLAVPVFERMTRVASAGVDTQDLRASQVGYASHIRVYHQREGNDCHLVIYQVGLSGGREDIRVADLDSARFNLAQAGETPTTLHGDAGTGTQRLVFRRDCSHKRL